MKRVRSGNWRSAATARRESSRKSPTFSGMSIGADASHRAVEHARRGLLEPGLLGAAPAPHQHDVVALAPLARIISGISSGGSCRSASMTTTASPRAASSPALIATSLPKLRDSSITATRASRPCSSVKQRHRAVAAAVVHVDDFRVGVDRVEHRAEPAMEVEQHRLFVVQRERRRTANGGGRRSRAVVRLSALRTSICDSRGIPRSSTAPVATTWATR